MIRKLVIVATLAMAAGSIWASSAFADAEATLTGTATGSMSCTPGDTIMCTLTNPSGDIPAAAAGATTAPLVMGFSGTGCATGTHIALLFDTNVPQSQGALIVAGQTKTGALIVANGIPNGNTVAGAFTAGLLAIKSWGLVSMDLPLKAQNTYKVLGCGNASGAAGAQPTATTAAGQPAATTPAGQATATRTTTPPSTGTGIDSAGVSAAIAVVAASLAMGGLGLLVTGMRRRGS